MQLSARSTVGGVFTTELYRHRLMSKALESGDPGKVAWTAKFLRATGAGLGQYDLLDTDEDPNLVPTEGLNDLLSVWVAGASQVSNRYVALFSSNSTPAANWTSANFHSTNCTEWEGYDESTRPLWNKGAVSAGSVSNSANKAVFTCATSGAATLYGAALLSASAKNGSSDATGKLYAATKFSTARAVVATDVINVQYTLSATSS